jgi:hypothetical protein
VGVHQHDVLESPVDVFDERPQPKRAAVADVEDLFAEALPPQHLDDFIEHQHYRGRGEGDGALNDACSSEVLKGRVGST